jgi:hypothetical protein
MNTDHGPPERATDALDRNIRIDEIRTALAAIQAGHVQCANCHARAQQVTRHSNGLWALCRTWAYSESLDRRIAEQRQRYARMRRPL